MQLGYDHDVLQTATSADGGAFTYAYDELGRRLSQTWLFQGRTYTTTAHFNSAGCLDEVVYPSGTRVTMACDAKNRTQSVSAMLGTTNQTIASAVAYHANDRPSSVTYGNGKTVTTVLDSGRVKSIAATGVMGLSYGYDGASNVNALDRITDVQTAAGKLSYGYDDLGNRTQVTTPAGSTTFVYDPKTNRLASSKGPSLPLPGALSWNAAQRLASSFDGASYFYDGSGRRVLRSSPSGGTVYHYDFQGRLIAETLPNGTRIRDYFYVGDQLVAAAGCVTSASPTPPCSEVEWIHTDVLGDLVARSNAQGAVTARTTYQPWGEVSASAPTQPGNRQFGGHVRDAGTGYYDFACPVLEPRSAVEGGPRHAGLERVRVRVEQPVQVCRPERQGADRGGDERRLFQGGSRAAQLRAPADQQGPGLRRRRHLSHGQARGRKARARQRPEPRTLRGYGQGGQAIYLQARLGLRLGRNPGS